MKKPCLSYGERPYAMKKHWATRLHDDLRLEWNGVLLSWALPAGPSYRPGEARPAIEMEDHRTENILFEGVHRTGPIMVWDRGSWEPHPNAEGLPASLEEGFLLFTLRGERLHGVFTLVRKQAAVGDRRVAWELCKEAELAGGVSVDWNVSEAPPTSILTGKTVEQIVQDWYGVRDQQPGLFEAVDFEAAPRMHSSLFGTKAA